MPSPTPIADTAAQPFVRGAFPWRTCALIAGDLVVFVVFAGVGLASHGEASGLGALLSVAGTALPFALGWFAVAPFFGAFHRTKTGRLAEMLARTELAWLCAWPVALGLRFVLAGDHSLTMPFPLIVLAFNALFLGVWRGAFALLVSRRR
jgi:hypothetical protein